MDISIAVIIPVYNVENYLYQCLDSIVGQTIHFDEAILINDGSTDNSLSICQEYVSKYKYFKLIDQENQGLSVARNIGIQHACSEYIMFLDSDDYLRLDTVEILKKQFLKFPYDAVFFDADIICEMEGEFCKKNIYDRSAAGLDGKELSGWEYFAQCYPKNYVVSSCMAAYKKDTIISKNIKFPEGIYFEDNYFTLMFISQARSVIHISEKLYQRRYRENSITTSKYSERKFTDGIKCYLLVLDNICQMECDVLIKFKEKLLEFVTDWCNNIHDNYCTCIKQNIKLERNSICLFYSMQEQYLFILDKLQLDLSSLSLIVLNKLLKCFHYTKYYELENKGHIEEIANEIIDVMKSLYFHTLSGLPLNKKCKIGIYGTGKHTEGLLYMFEKLVGEIVCELIFLDSQRDNEMYNRWKVINYQKVNDENLDLIIISSFLYEKEMLHNIKKVNTDIPIYTFYNTLEEDIFSEQKIFLKYC